MIDHYLSMDLKDAPIFTLLEMLSVAGHRAYTLANLVAEIEDSGLFGASYLEELKAVARAATEEKRNLQYAVKARVNP